MSYAPNQIVTRNDFNNLVSSTNEIFNDTHINETIEALANHGYGQTPAVQTVTLGEQITASKWNAIFSAVKSCANHQGTAPGAFPTAESTGSIITAYNDLLTTIDNIKTNRLNVDPGSLSVTSNGTKLTVTRTTSWTGTIYHEFEVNFGNYNTARYFFNSGGQIRFSASRTGGTSNSQNTAFSNLLTSAGTIIFGHTDTMTTGTGTTSAIGFYNLTNSYQEIYRITATTGGSYSYGTDKYIIEARSVGNFGTSGILKFKVTFDGDTDAINGTLSSKIDERRVNGIHLTLPSPIYTSTYDLNGGGSGPTGIKNPASKTYTIGADQFPAYIVHSVQSLGVSAGDTGIGGAMWNGSAYVAPTVYPGFQVDEWWDNTAGAIPSNRYYLYATILSEVGGTTTKTGIFNSGLVLGPTGSEYQHRIEFNGEDAVVVVKFEIKDALNSNAVVATWNITYDLDSLAEVVDDNFTHMVVRNTSFANGELNGSFEFRANGELVVEGVRTPPNSIVDVDTNTGTTNMNWFSTSTPPAGRYYVRVTHVSGDVPEGTLNTWLPIDQDRAWALIAQTSGVYTKSSTLNYQILDNVTSVVVLNKNVTMLVWFG